MKNQLPNIISLTCHDLGRYLGCYGIETVRTPNIDRLAVEGVRFTNSYCAAPQCSPARSALYTGRYPHANGVMGLTHANFKWDFHPGEKHQAAILAERGYHCVQMAVQHETPHPDRMGFHEVPQTLTYEPEDEGHRCWRDARQAVGLFEQQQQTDKPFFLQIGFFEPHRAPKEPTGWPQTNVDPARPVTIPPFIVDDDEAQQDFAHFQSVIEDMDVAVGRMMDSLDRLGLADNTMFMFTADHGIPFPRAKCSVYEPGLEVPLIVRWPDGGVSGGRVEEDFVSHVDVLPTLDELLDLNLPTNLHGISFASVLRGEDATAREAVFGEQTWHTYYDPLRSVRVGRHKLIVSFTPVPTFSDPQQKYHRSVRAVCEHLPPHGRDRTVELYDLDADPVEQTNLIDDPAYTEVRTQLQTRLANWMRETNDPLLCEIPMPPMHQQTLNALGICVAKTCPGMSHKC